MAPGAAGALLDYDMQLTVSADTGWGVRLDDGEAPGRFVAAITPPDHAALMTTGCLALEIPRRYHVRTAEMKHATTGDAEEDNGNRCCMRIHYDTRGPGTAVARCPRHGERELTWKQSMAVGFALRDVGMLSEADVDRMIDARHALEKPQDVNTRVLQWLGTGP